MVVFQNTECGSGDDASTRLRMVRTKLEGIYRYRYIYIYTGIY